MPQVFAGTSGFAYPNWKPRFYPEKLPASKFLEYYASRLNSVEVNYTFRRLPSAATLEKWVAATPSSFRFALKAHQRITHFQQLKNSGEFTAAFLGAIEPLRSARRLGPVLFQLPPTLGCDLALLQDYLRLLPSDIRYAFEFRHESWLGDSVYRLLAERNVSLCVAESEKIEVPKVFTANFVYFRLRKPEYSPEDLAGIRRQVEAVAESGKDVFVFFKHEEEPEGALYAEQVLAGKV